jgi:hypothetical protein
VLFGVQPATAKNRRTAKPLIPTGLHHPRPLGSKSQLTNLAK